jgi:threonylcarbamoyladenosine tRNA methylthiotransferase MtaB
MPQVAPNIRKERAAILRQEGEMELIRFLERKIGTVESYIVEQDLTARGGDFTHMRLLDHTAIPGQIINARALRVEKNILIGEQVA